MVSHAEIDRALVQEIRRVQLALAKPIIVYDTAWAESIPEWMKAEIHTQRLIQLVKREDGMATIAEALAYLFPASLMHPFDSDWANIYLWLGAECNLSRGVKVPAEIAPKELSSDQRQQLAKLRAWIWKRAEEACPRPAADAGTSALQRAECNELWLFKAS